MSTAIDMMQKKMQEQRQMAMRDPQGFQRLAAELGEEGLFSVDVFGVKDLNTNKPFKGYARPSVFTPAKLPDFTHNARFLKAMAIARKQRRRKGLRISGPQGCGKTENAFQFFAYLNLPIQFQQCHKDMDVPEMIGDYMLLNGQQVWVDGPLTIAARYGHVYYLSEEDRAKADVKIFLNPILEGRPLTIPRTKEVIVPHPDFWVVGDGNTSYEGDVNGHFPGAKPLDRSTMNRYFHLVMDYYPEKFEIALLLKRFPEFAAKAEARNSIEAIVKTANNVRALFKASEVDVPLSTRDLIAWVEVMQDAQELGQAGENDSLNPFEYGFRYIYFDSLSDEHRERAAKAYNDAMGKDQDLALDIRSVASGGWDHA